jgi:hypothetical protein
MIVADALSRMPNHTLTPSEISLTQSRPVLNPSQFIGSNQTPFLNAQDLPEKEPSSFVVPLNASPKLAALLHLCSTVVHDLDQLHQDIIKATQLITDLPPGFHKTNEVITNDLNQCLVLDHSLQQRILLSYHDLAGHLGIARTASSILSQFYWPNLFKSVRSFISSCDTCQRSKRSRAPPAGKLLPFRPPSQPWAEISMDHIVGLPPINGLDAILTVICRYSKHAHFIACKTTDNAQDLALIFLHHIFKLHGLPRSIVSDRGPTFISKFWRSLCALLKIKLKFSSGFHPQTNGQAENANALIAQLLRTLVSDTQTDWVDMLPIAEFQFNSKISSATSLSPFQVIYGCNPSFSLPPWNEINNASLPSIQELTSRWQRIYSIVDTNLSRAESDALKKTDRHRSQQPSYAIGDLVLLSNSNLPDSILHRKLDHKWVGPFPILRIINAAAVVLKLPTSWKTHPSFHVSQIKPYHSDPHKKAKPPPEPTLIDGSLEYSVESILKKKISARGIFYLVKWKNYGVEENSWEPVKNLKNCRDLVEKFERTLTG